MSSSTLPSIRYDTETEYILDLPSDGELISHDPIDLSVLENLEPKDLMFFRDFLREHSKVHTQGFSRIADIIDMRIDQMSEPQRRLWRQGFGHPVWNSDHMMVEYFYDDEGLRAHRHYRIRETQRIYDGSMENSRALAAELRETMRLPEGPWSSDDNMYTHSFGGTFLDEEEFDKYIEGLEEHKIWRLASRTLNVKNHRPFGWRVVKNAGSKLNQLNEGLKESETRTLGIATTAQADGNLPPSQQNKVALPNLDILNAGLKRLEETIGNEETLVPVSIHPHCLHHPRGGDASIPILSNKVEIIAIFNTPIKNQEEFRRARRAWTKEERQLECDLRFGWTYAGNQRVSKHAVKEASIRYNRALCDLDIIREDELPHFIQFSESADNTRKVAASQDLVLERVLKYVADPPFEPDFPSSSNPIELDNYWAVYKRVTWNSVIRTHPGWDFDARAFYIHMVEWTNNPEVAVDVTKLAIAAGNPETWPGKRYWTERGREECHGVCVIFFGIKFSNYVDWLKYRALIIKYFDWLQDDIFDVLEDDYIRLRWNNGVLEHGGGASLDSKHAESFGFRSGRNKTPFCAFWIDDLKVREAFWRGYRDVISPRVPLNPNLDADLVYRSIRDGSFFSKANGYKTAIKHFNEDMARRQTQLAIQEGKYGEWPSEEYWIKDEPREARQAESRSAERTLCASPKTNSVTGSRPIFYLPPLRLHTETYQRSSATTTLVATASQSPASLSGSSQPHSCCPSIHNHPTNPMQASVEDCMSTTSSSRPRNAGLISRRNPCAQQSGISARPRPQVKNAEHIEENAVQQRERNVSAPSRAGSPTISDSPRPEQGSWRDV